MTDISSEIQFFGQAVDIARDRFQSFNNRGGEAKTQLVENKYGLFAPWAAIILVSGGDYRLTFKVHFTLLQATKFAIDGNDSETPTLDPAKVKIMSFDYMKEFCNLYAGSLKRAFADANISVGISLPLLTRGFDEVFFPKADFKNTFEVFWDILNDLGGVRCSLFVEVINADNFKSLNIKLDSSNEGEIDFL